MMMEFDPTRYSNVHRRFMQTVMGHGSLTIADSLKCMHACLRAEVTADENEEVVISDEDNLTLLKSMLNSINAQLRPFQLELKIAFSEYDGEQYIMMINQYTNTDREKWGTDKTTMFSEPEMELFKKILRHILDSERGSIRSTDAINKTKELDKAPKANQVEAMFAKLKRYKWLFESRGRLYLNTRLIVELKSLLQEMGGVMCGLKCGQLVIIKQGAICGQKLQDGDTCTTRVHKRCMAKYAKKQPANCPTCNKHWVHVDVSENE